MNDFVVKSQLESLKTLTLELNFFLYIRDLEEKKR